MSDSRQDVVETACPVCNRKLDAATSVMDEARPRDGDISICLYCGSLLVFQGGKPVKPESIDNILDSMDTETRALVERTQAAVLLRERGGATMPEAKRDAHRGETGDGGLAAGELVCQAWKDIVKDTGNKYVFEDGEATAHQIVGNYLDEMAKRLKKARKKR